MSKKPSNKAGKKGAPAGVRSARGKRAVGSSKSGATPTTNGLSTPAKVVIIIFAVLMVVSLMMPTLSTAFSANQQAEQSGSQDSEADSSSDSSTDSSDSSSTDASAATGAAAVDAKYQDAGSELESKLASDNTNRATLLSLGRNYMRWGASVISVSSSDSDTSHGNELLEKAVGYYEQYLDLKDSDAVRVDIALCKLYEGDTSEAKSQLETLTQNSPTYAPAWANLGMVQEYSGDKDAAKTSYQAAIDNDPNDEYGAKTYATQRLAALESSSSTTSTTTNSTTSSTSGETGAKGLTDTLNSLSGTGL